MYNLSRNDFLPPTTSSEKLGRVCKMADEISKVTDTLQRYGQPEISVFNKIAEVCSIVGYFCRDSQILRGSRKETRRSFVLFLRRNAKSALRPNTKSALWRNVKSASRRSGAQHCFFLAAKRQISRVTKRRIGFVGKRETALSLLCVEKPDQLCGEPGNRFVSSL